MKWRESPGRVIHPRPAPGIDPRPMPVMIRRPPGGDAAWIPDIAVLRIGAPGAVIVQVFVTDHLRIHVSPRRTAVLARDPGEAPLIEGIHAPRRFDIERDLIGSGCDHLRAGIDR